MKTILSKTTCFAFMFLFVLSFANKANAVPPANDNCSGAILVSTVTYNDMGATYTAANTSGATASAPNPSCITSNDNNDDIWYKFVAVTQTELLRVHTVVAGSTYTTLGYALYDGCGGTEIYCNNGMATFYGNEMLGGLTPGNTYYLRFWSQGQFTNMTFSFAVMDIIPQTPGDDAGTATPLTINAAGQHCINPLFYTTASASRSPNDPYCNTDNDDDVWFSFTCPAHAVNIYPEEGSLIATGGFANMAMQILDATLGETDGSCTANYGVGSTTSFTGIPGHVYNIRIWTMGTGDHAVFSLCLQDGYDVLPDNNTCNTATNLVVGAGTCTNALLGDLFNADVTAALTGNPSCTVNFTLKNDVWYKATVPASGNIVVQTSATHSAVNDVVLIAYTNNCTTFTQIACDEDGNTGLFPNANHSRISLAGRTPGEIIYYRVIPRNTDNMGQFSICAFDETIPPLPSVTITDVKKNEGNSGTKQFDFTVTLSSVSGSTVTVKYKTVNGTAVAPTDYTSIANTVLTFNPGETAKTVSVTVNGDITVESNETFKVKLSNPINCTIADDQGKGTIKDDDGPSPFSAEQKSITSYYSNKFRIYPNPVTDKLNIDLPASNKSYTIYILDIAGRTAMQVKTAASQKSISVNTSGLSKGTYLIKIGSDNENASLKFVKE